MTDVFNVHHFDDQRLYQQQHVVTEQGCILQEVRGSGTTLKGDVGNARSVITLHKIKKKKRKKSACVILKHFEMH